MWQATFQMFRKWRIQRELPETENCSHTQLSEPRFVSDLRFLSAGFWMFLRTEERQRKGRRRQGHDSLLLHFHLISVKWHQNWLCLYPSMNFSLQRSSNHGMVQKGDTHRCKKKKKTRSSKSPIRVMKQQSLSWEIMLPWRRWMRIPIRISLPYSWTRTLRQNYAENFLSLILTKYLPNSFPMQNIACKWMYVCNLQRLKHKIEWRLCWHLPQNPSYGLQALRAYGLQDSAAAPCTWSNHQSWEC